MDYFVPFRNYFCTNTNIIALDLSHNLAMPDPGHEYQRRLESRRVRLQQKTAEDARLSYARLATFVAGMAIAGIAARTGLSWWWILPVVAAFLWLLRRHDAVIEARVQAERAVGFYERGVARLQDTWAGQGQPGDRFADTDHPYAADLDLFGHGSLFQLLSIARTRAGEEQLAGWLKAPASPDAIRERQEAITELAALPDLREAVALAGIDAAVGVHSDPLLVWAEQPPQLTGKWQRPAAIVLTAASIAAAAFWMQGGTGTPLFVAVVAGVALFAAHRRRIHRLLEASNLWSRDLDVFAHVLVHLERAQFVSGPLERLRQRLDTNGAPPSSAIRQLHRLAEMHDWQHNLLFAIVATPLLWDVHIAFAMESWRRRFGSRVRVWLESVGEFEALSSLATYRFEHPDDAMPVILDSAEGAVFDGVGLGHPLLPTSRMVRNDVALGKDVLMLIVSGSNMSGKSTLLRTVGVNVVLALAGAPARATALRVTPVVLGATLRIQDSLQQGRSRFYAEISRIRELADLARSRPPLLFLLDELFHGTNSHDRLVGAAGVLRSLLDRGAVGLITTHDLALTAIAAELPGAINVHFEDRFDAAEIGFDYRMKPGPVTRSNAVALMRAVGLDVPLP